MNRSRIYAMTEKGDRLAASPSQELSPALRMVFEAIDGKSSVDAMLVRLAPLSEESLDEALSALATDGLIYDIDGQPDGQSARMAQELRAKIKARRGGTERSSPDGDVRDSAADEQVRQLAEEQALREAAERARQEAEAQTKQLAAELARRDIEAKARREAEERERKVAEEQALRETAERARQEAEAQAQRMAAELARRDAEEKERQEAAEASRREDERIRQEAEEQARVEAEQKAWLEAQEKFRRDEEAAAAESAKRAAAKAAKTATGRSRGPGNLVLVVLLGLVALAVTGLVVIHLISFDGQIPQFEKVASAQFQQPVKIKALRLSLLPHVQLRLEGVSIGAEGQIVVPVIRAKGDLGNLFSEKKSFRSVELESPVISETGLGWLLFGKPAGHDVVTGQVTASNARIESANLGFPAFGAKVQFEGEGAWKSIAMEATDKSVNVELEPKGGAVQIDFKARSYKLPLGSSLVLDDFVASGSVTANELAVTTFKGFAYGGILSGNAKLKWGPAWSLAGELSAKQVDMERLVPGLMDGGRLSGEAAYAMQAPDASRLLAGNRLDGNFVVARGVLKGVDLGRMMQGGTMAGDTRFSEISGSLLHERGVTQLRQLRLAEGAISASGSTEVDADSNVRGRFAVELKMSSEQRRANLVLSGTLKKIEWRRP